MGLDICNFSIKAWPILNIHSFNHWKKIQIDRDIFFYVRSEKRSGPIESWDKFELSIVWSVRLRQDISQILCLTFCDIECHKNSLSIRHKVYTFLTSWCFWVTGQIHQSSYQVRIQIVDESWDDRTQGWDEHSPFHLSEVWINWNF